MAVIMNLMQEHENKYNEIIRLSDKELTDMYINEYIFFHNLKLDDDVYGSIHAEPRDEKIRVILFFYIRKITKNVGRIW